MDALADLMDGYRQTLLGRALADALREVERADGDLLFELFDEAMRRELRTKTRSRQTHTHDTLELTGRVTAFNRFMDDWNVQAQVTPRDVKLDHAVADLHLPGQQEQEQEIPVRLKLRKQK